MCVGCEKASGWASKPGGKKRDGEGRGRGNWETFLKGHRLRTFLADPTGIRRSWQQGLGTTTETQTESGKCQKDKFPHFLLDTGACVCGKGWELILQPHLRSPVPKHVLLMPWGRRNSRTWLENSVEIYSAVWMEVGARHRKQKLDPHLE